MRHWAASAIVDPCVLKVQAPTCHGRNLRQLAPGTCVDPRRLSCAAPLRRKRSTGPRRERPEGCPRLSTRLDDQCREKHHRGPAGRIETKLQSCLGPDSKSEKRPVRSKPLGHLEWQTDANSSCTRRQWPADTRKKAKKIAALELRFSHRLAGQKPTLACTKNVRGSPRYNPALLSLERV